MTVAITDADREADHDAAMLADVKADVYHTVLPILKRHREAAYAAGLAAGEVRGAKAMMEASAAFIATGGVHPDSLAGRWASLVRAIDPAAVVEASHDQP